MKSRRSLEQESFDSNMLMMNILSKALGAVLFLLVLVMGIMFLLPRLPVNLNLYPLEILPDAGVVELPPATVGVPYRAFFAAQGGNEYVRFVPAPGGTNAALPAGLDWAVRRPGGTSNALVCGIEGTPRGPPSTRTFALVAESSPVEDDADGRKWGQVPTSCRRSVPRTFRLTVVPPVVIQGEEACDLAIVSPADLPAACLDSNGVAAIQLAVKGGVWPYAWTISDAARAGGDPSESGSHLTIDRDGLVSVRVSGAPARIRFTAAVQSCKADVLERCGRRARDTRAFVCDILPVGGAPLRLAMPPCLPDAREGQPYRAAIKAEGGCAPFTWSLSGVRPAFLPVHGTPGRTLMLEGTPTHSDAGRHDFVVEVADARQRCTETVQLAVLPAPRPLRILSTNLPAALVGQPYAAALAFEGGEPPLRWTVERGSLPPGMTLASEQGVVSGRSQVPDARPQACTVRVTQSDGAYAEATVALPVWQAIKPEPLVILSLANLPDGVAGRPYALQLAAAGGLPPYRWRMADGGGQEMDGLVLSPDGSFVQAALRRSGRFASTVVVTDAAGAEAVRSFGLTVRESPPDGRAPKVRIVTPERLPVAIVGRPYAVALAAEGGRPPYGWSAGAGLPDWLHLVDGMLTGTPTRATSAPARFAVNLTDGQTPADADRRDVEVGVELLRSAKDMAARPLRWLGLLAVVAFNVWANRLWQWHCLAQANKRRS